MDVPVALLTVFIVYGAVKYLNELAPNGLPSALKVPCAVLVGIGVAFLMAQTDFASKQVFFDRSLDVMNAGSLAVVGIALGFGAVGVDTAFKTIRNVGENDTPS
jgi:hypothetical protein